jgi:hypothetical protein
MRARNCEHDEGVSQILLASGALKLSVSEWFLTKLNAVVGAGIDCCQSTFRIGKDAEKNTGRYCVHDL